MLLGLYPVGSPFQRINVRGAGRLTCASDAGSGVYGALAVDRVRIKEVILKNNPPAAREQMRAASGCS
jgi:hypothetical protein